MSGKLPIDRVREAEDAPRIYEEHKQRFSEERAKLRAGDAPIGEDAAAPGESATPASDDA